MDRPLDGALLESKPIQSGNAQYADCQFSVLNPNYLLILFEDSSLFLVSMTTDLRLDFAEYHIKLSDTMKP